MKVTPANQPSQLPNIATWNNHIGSAKPWLSHYCSNTIARTLSIGWVTYTNITEKMVEEDNLLPPLLRDFLGATTLLCNGQGAAHSELR
jgi:hypothetical protein